MGTRHLIAVQLDGQYRIAQYGQWDGYPDGQGRTVLEFLATMDRTKFESKLRASRFCTADDFKEIQETIDREGLKDSWGKRWPELSRDAGANILSIVCDAPDGIRLRDSISFAADSLFCEFGYVIDLDNNTLEVYKGFNKEPLTEGRFKDAIRDDDANPEYHPIRLAGQWTLDSLPTTWQMLSAVCPDEVS